MATRATGAESQSSKQTVLSTLPKELPLDFLKTITDLFSEKNVLGVGAFGTTYKGIMPDGQPIVVKKLAQNSPVAQDKTFQNEVMNIMALRHDNVVQLVGYCHEGQKKVVLNNGRYIMADIVESLICYEYPHMGTLHDNLFGKTSIDIDWSTRFKIINGICQGLAFIHSTNIVHMDLKPENIWLDDKMVPKIANFGLSRIFGQEQTRAYTQNVVGSYGYMAPEYLYRGEISNKSDIYSLGLLIMEISTGEKNCPGNEPSSAQYIKKIREEWKEGRIAAMYRTLYADALIVVRNCLQIGLECVEIDRQKRPSIETIIDKLEGRRPC